VIPTYYVANLTKLVDVGDILGEMQETRDIVDVYLVRKKNTNE